jgi:hypothetical protein
LCVALCKEKGYTIPDEFKRLKTYVTNIESHFPILERIFMSSYEKAAIKSYSLVSTRDMQDYIEVNNLNSGDIFVVNNR